MKVPRKTTSVLVKTHASNTFKEAALSSTSLKSPELRRTSIIATGGAAVIEKQFQAPAELDLFAMETRARRTIGELMKPIIVELDNDRRKVAEVDATQLRINSRLH